MANWLLTDPSSSIDNINAHNPAEITMHSWDLFKAFNNYAVIV